MAKVNVSFVKGIMISIIVVVILFTILDDTAADIQDASSNLTKNYTASNETSEAVDTYPLIGFFAKKGILLLAFIAGIIIMLIGAFMSGKK